MTDSPALASLVGRLPSLRGHVLSQGDIPSSTADTNANDAEIDADTGVVTGQAHGRRLDDQMYLEVPSLTDAALAVDLWMLGAADHVISASTSTLTTWASRSIERNGRPHVLSCLTQSAGNKVIPVCGSPCVNQLQVSCPCDTLVYQKGRQGSSADAARCEAKRFALFSDATMSSLVEGVNP